MKSLKIALLFFFILNFYGVYGQSHVRRTNSFSSYKDRLNEFGYSVNIAYQKNERVLAPHLHVHYTKLITEFFSLGVGYNGTYDMHFHNSLALEMGIRFLPELYIAIKPGIVFKNVYSSLMYEFGVEAGYEFNIGDTMHIGPMAEINLVQDDVVYIAGFHMGMMF